MRLSDNADMRKRLLTAAWLHEPFPMLISILGGTNAFVRIPFQAFSSEVIFAQAFPYRLSPPGGSLKGFLLCYFSSSSLLHFYYNMQKAICQGLFGNSAQ